MMRVQVSKGSQSASGAMRCSSAPMLTRTARSSTALQEQRLSLRVARSTAFVSATPLALFSKHSFHSSKCTKDEAATSHTSNSSLPSTKPQPPRAPATEQPVGHVVGAVHVVSAEYQSLEGIAAVETLPTAFKVENEAEAQAEVHLKEALEMLEKQKHDEAAQLLQRALAFKPDHVKATFHLGEAHSASGKHQEAIEQFLKVTKMAPPENKLVQEAWYGLGQSYIALKQFKSVVFAMDKMIKVNRNDPSVHYNRGYALMMLEIFDYAVRCLDVTLHLNPKHLSALQCKAYCFIQQKKYTEALELLETALQLDRDHPTTLSYQQHARRMYLRQKGVYAFDEIFPTSAERQNKLPVRFRRALLPTVLMRPT